MAVTEYKNHTSLSYPFIFLLELFQWVAPVALIFVTASGVPPEAWRHPWDAVASVAGAIFVGAVAFLGLQWMGVVPLTVHVSLDGLGIKKLWTHYELFRWSDVKAIRSHAWLNQLDIFVTRRIPVSKKIVIFNMPKRQITELLGDIKRYAPEVKVKRF